MAKFTGGDLRLKDSQKVTFGTSLDSNLWWDGGANDLRLDTTISGLNPTQDYHLATKSYVDDTTGSGYWQKVGTVLKPAIADDTIEIPLSAGGKIELGSLDAFSRTQIWNYLTDSILKLGSAQADGDAINATSEGCVVYGKNLEDDPMGASDFSYMRIKPDRIGLYNSKLTGYVGYLFRIDLSSNDCYLRDNTGVKTLQFDRLTGELVTNGDITASGTKLSECVLVDGTRAFTGVVGGITPTANNHLATKSYVDDNDCPTYLYIKSSGQSEGDLHLSGANWGVSKALIKTVRIVTSSTDWDLYILQNDNGHATNDAGIPEVQIMGGGNGNLNIYLDLAYRDEDGSGEVHLYYADNSGANTADIYVIGYGLK